MTGRGRGVDYCGPIVDPQDSGAAAPKSASPAGTDRLRRPAESAQLAADPAARPGTRPASFDPAGDPAARGAGAPGSAAQGAAGAPDPATDLAPYDLNPDDTGVLTTVPEVAPAVVVVMVTHNPGPWFVQSLEALGHQTYPNLSVLIVDAGSTIDPTPRVAEVLPHAYVKRLDHNPGFGAAANQVLDLVEGAAFYCMCHDDVAPDPDAIRVLVEEAFRSNAGLIGPKLVDWDDPSVLQQVGVAADKAGVLAPYADHGELDQEQHDAVRDVFAVPSACTLVRADLFAAVSGYDPAIKRHGEDLDLSWRSHVAGARVMVAPGARVRHREADAERGTDEDRVRLGARNRVHTLLTCYSRWSLVRVVPQAFVVSMLEAIYGLFAGRADVTRAEIGAWWWNFRHWGAVRARRKTVGNVRRVPDKEIRNLQTRGSTRVSTFVRAQLGGGDDRLRAMAKRREAGVRLGSAARRFGIVTVIIAAAVFVLGSRNLLFGDLPAIGGFVRFSEGPFDLVRNWWSGWRDIGLGAGSGAPAGLGVFGVLGTVFFGAMGVLRKAVILGMLPLGAWGAWRLARPIGSVTSRAVALLVFIAIPVPYNAIAQGRWDGLVIWAFAPWMLLGLCRGAGIAPYGRRDLRAGSASTDATRPTRPLSAQIVGLGLAVGLAAVVAPAAAGVVIVVAAGVVLGSLLTFRLGSIPRVLAVAAGAVAIAILLHLPWALGFTHDGSQWLPFVGGRAAEGGTLSVGHLLRFQSGPIGAAPLGWAFIVVAALPLLIGRSWRFEWAVRGWSVAVVCWGLVWAGQAGWLGFALPPAEVLLAPAAIGLAFAAGLGVAAFEVDLPSYKFGWRQGAVIVAGLALIAGGLPVIGAAFDGSWNAPGSGFDQQLSFIGSQARTSAFRVLWVGDPDVMPVGAWRIDDTLSYGTSNHGLPSLGESWATPAPGASSQLEAAIRLATHGETARLGHLLAPLGVRYIVVPGQVAPVPSWGHHVPPPEALPASLDDQLDLAPIDALNPAVSVWTNRAWQPMPALVPGRQIPDRTNLGDAADLTLPATDKPALTYAPDHRSAHGELSDTGQLLVDQADDRGWNLTVDGQKADRAAAFGGATRYAVPARGGARLWYATPAGAIALSVLQVVLWLAVLDIWRRVNGADRRREAREVRLPRRRTGPDPIRERLWHQ